MLSKTLNNIRVFECSFQIFFMKEKMLESLSYIRLSSLIYFKHFFAIQQRNACQRKCTKGRETVSVSLPLDFYFSVTRRARRGGRQREVFHVPSSVGHRDLPTGHGFYVGRHKGRVLTIGGASRHKGRVLPAEIKTFFQNPLT